LSAARAALRHTAQRRAQIERVRQESNNRELPAPDVNLSRRKWNKAFGKWLTVFAEVGFFLIFF